MEHTFSNGKWKSFTTEKGETIVEFDGSHPFGKLYDPSTGESSCTGYLVCAALLKKFENDCNSNSDALNYQNTHDNLALQISEVEKQIQDLYKQGIHNDNIRPNGTLNPGQSEQQREDLLKQETDNHNRGVDELTAKRLQLWGQLSNLQDPKPALLRQRLQAKRRRPDSRRRAVLHQLRWYLPVRGKRPFLEPRETLLQYVQVGF